MEFGVVQVKVVGYQANLSRVTSTRNDVLLAF